VIDAMILSFAAKGLHIVDLMPAAYALNLVEIARQQHLDLLGVAGLDKAVLEVDAYIPSKIYLHIVRTFDHLSRDPAWGFDIGQRLGMNAHGVLGLAAVSAPTVGLGVVSLCRYIRIRSSLLRASTVNAKGQLLAEFVHDEILQEQLPHACEIVAMMLQSLLSATTGRQQLPLQWRFPYAEPDYSQSYTDHLWGQVSFGASSLQLLLPGSVTELASLLRDDALCASAQRKCVELLRELYTASRAELWLADVRAQLNSVYAARTQGASLNVDIPTADQVAARLHISTRTLMRRLRQADTSLKALKDQVSTIYLREMLREGRLSAGEMGQRLGFDNAGNFTRACKRLLGAPPQHLMRRTQR
jgi:AraC-like DNA-binding protein